MKEPESMEECVYFTRRDNEKGKIKVWVFREKCPNCNDELMGKPKDPKQENQKQEQIIMNVLDANIQFLKKNMKKH